MTDDVNDWIRERAGRAPASRTEAAPIEGRIRRYLETTGSETWTMAAVEESEQAIDSGLGPRGSTAPRSLTEELNARLRAAVHRRRR